LDDRNPRRDPKWLQHFDHLMQYSRLAPIEFRDTIESMASQVWIKLAD